MRNRLAITRVGTVGVRDGGFVADGWGFDHTIGGLDSVVTPVVDGKLNGWTAVELHAIAHGVPCDCPIGREHAAKFPLD